VRYNFIAIEGNIGSGKTTLSSKIAKEFNGSLVLEAFENNPFLPKFYKNPEKYAFSLELFFLAERYHQLKDLLSSPDLFTSFTISDYYLNKSLVFAKATLDEDEYALFSRLYHIMYSKLTRPDLLVYLYMDVENLQKNIRKRGRGYEQEISDEYLQRIHDSYFDFLKKQQDLRILIIDTNNIDFVHNPNDYKMLLDIMDKDYAFGIHRIVL
jgi:deoxyguanosine kinase